MISISRSRKILGELDANLSDEEIELMLNQFYALAEVMFEHYGFFVNFKEVKSKNDKS